MSVANYRSHKLGGATTVGSLGLAAATLGCPSCALPVTATLGVAVFGTALPLLGLEFQFASFVALLVALVWLSRKMRHEYTMPAAAASDAKLTVPTG